MSDADPMWQFQERERRLVREIVEFLDAPETNPNRGSVPPRPNPPKASDEVGQFRHKRRGGV